MTADLAAGLVARWVRRYTRDLPGDVARRRVEEIDADVLDHVAHARAMGAREPAIAIDLLSRMVRGVPADLAWRGERAAVIRHRTRSGGPMTGQTAYRLGLAVAIASILFLAWGVGAMGIIGSEGDPFDLAYLALAGVGIVVAALVRFQSTAMVRVMGAMAAATGVITVAAIVLGKQDDPSTSWLELLGLNAMYAVLFLGAAWLFRRADEGSTATA